MPVSLGKEVEAWRAQVNDSIRLFRNTKGVLRWLLAGRIFAEFTGFGMYVFSRLEGYSAEQVKDQGNWSRE